MHSSSYEYLGFVFYGKDNVYSRLNDARAHARIHTQVCNLNTILCFDVEFNSGSA